MSLAETFYQEQQELIRKQSGSMKEIPPMPRQPLIAPKFEAAAKVPEDVFVFDGSTARKRITRWPNRKKIGLTALLGEGTSMRRWMWCRV